MTAASTRSDAKPAPGGGLRVERDGPIGWIVLDRPERRNAIDRATRAALAEAAASLESDDDVRVVVLTGEGSAFCTGTDLREPPLPDAPPPAADGTPRISAALESLTKPVIASVNGPAAGGGFELVLAADLRVAASTATFALPEVRVGSLPGSGGTQRLFDAVPQALAWRMLLTGQSIDADEALRVGLVSDVVDPERLRPLAAELAASIAANAPLSVRAAVLAGRQASAAGKQPGLALERALWALLATTDDRAEGRAAFRERRPPAFRGR
ncbi:MAG TPA: enoyl-CoA hydratase/isomerase family protein [Candidatus Limnocylindrales bacterium]|jgi:enoyl-CoA hydratase/carnithine racemase